MVCALLSDMREQTYTTAARGIGISDWYPASKICEHLALSLHEVYASLLELDSVWELVAWL